MLVHDQFQVRTAFPKDGGREPGQTKGISGLQSCYAQGGEQKYHAPCCKENSVTQPVISSNEVTIIHLKSQSGN